MRCTLLVLLAGAILCAPARAQQDDGLGQIRRELQETKEKLRQRDALIEDLARRVRDLERRRAGSRGQVTRLAATPRPASTRPSSQVLAQPLAPTVSSLTPPTATVRSPPLTRTETAEPKPVSGLVTVDELAAQRALERALVQQGFALLPKWDLEIEPAFTFSLAEFTYPSFLIGNGMTGIVNNNARQYSYIGDLVVRLGLPWNSQIDLYVPYRYLDQKTAVAQGNTVVSSSRLGGGGLGDISLTLNKVLFKEEDWRPNLIGAVQYGVNTSGSAQGLPLGNDYNVVRGLLTATKQLDPLVLVGQIGYGHGWAHRLTPGGEYDALIGMLMSVAPEASLNFQLQQRFFDTGRQTGVVVSGRTVTNFITGASVILAPRTLLDFSLGIGLTRDTPRYFFRISLPMRFSTG
jgi:hypothetical protein